MKYLQVFMFLYGIISYAQVGIGTTSPEGALDVVSNNQGIVVPRVSSINNVTDGNGNDAVDGTIVYDTNLQKTCYRVAGTWLCIGKDNNGNASIAIENGTFSQISNYIKASNTDQFDTFGWTVSLSEDGSRLAVGAYREASNASGINGDQSNNTLSFSGAVYVFGRTGSIWTQEAYIKASNPDAGDRFGWEVSLNADGSRLAVGAYLEDSNSNGINGDETNNTSVDSGAVYIFNRIGTNWSQEAYIKAINSNSNDQFGYTLGLSGDATRLVVGAYREDSGSSGVNGNVLDNSVADSGAAYVFVRSGTTWTHEAYIKSSNPDAGDFFSGHVDINYDGSRLLLNAAFEDSAATTVNGNQTDNSAVDAGAVYVFQRTGTTWNQEAYLKANNADAEDRFGWNVRISGDGNTAIIGAPNEDSNATGVNGDGTDNSSSNAGAVYIFSQMGGSWTQEAYLKLNYPDAFDSAGNAVSISNNGEKIAFSAAEDSNATNLNGDQTNNDLASAGGVFIYTKNNGIWCFSDYVKSSNTEAYDIFGLFMEISGDGSTLAVGAPGEDSNATGINGDQTNNSFSTAGAVYIIE